MAKIKTEYLCEECGYDSPQWAGKCPGCGNWNTFKAFSLGKNVKSSKQKRTGIIEPTSLRDVPIIDLERTKLTDPEMNRVLGGGLVPGSLILVGGEPGIGKSTLLLQLAASFNQQQVLYINGEESNVQIKMRAERLGLDSDNIKVYSELNTSKALEQLKKQKPDILIVDSIQTVFSPDSDAAPGSVSQIRQCASEFMRFAKEEDVPIFLVGHINKEGHLAGPKVLEHLVDTVLYFEGDKEHLYRILRVEKNRFGNTSELGIYEMRNNGLIPVLNPSAALIGQHQSRSSGIAISCCVRGQRPLLLEIQALVATSAYGQAQRSSLGFDSKRLNMLLAVLEKRFSYKFGNQDVFLNVAGGLNISEPALDLAVCMAIVSSLKDIPISEGSCFFAEIGLGGELRPVSQPSKRINEAVKLGFKKVTCASTDQLKDAPMDDSVKIVGSSKLDEVLNLYLPE